MDEFQVAENYIRYGQYPDSLGKGEKANLRRKCRNNFKFEAGILYYRKVTKQKDAENTWRICVRTEEEKKQIMESCHGGVEGNSYRPSYV